MEPNIGIKLSEDYWFTYNTLSLVFPWLNPSDLLRSCQVCKVWRQIAMDPVLWRSVTLNDCIVDFDKMADVLNTFGTNSLKLDGSTVVLNDSQVFNALKKMPSLRKLELSESTSKLIQTLPEANPKLEVIKANIICGIAGSNLNLKFLSGLPHITELKLYCNRELDTSIKALEYLKNLQHLYLLGVKNLSSVDFQNCHFRKLQTLGLGDCWQMCKNFGSTFLKTLTFLTTLRLESCRECHIVHILENVSHLKNLECLELLEINVDRGFDQCIALCKNIRKLTIVPNPNRLKMAKYNSTIIRGVVSLKGTLKNFTWGFIPRYLEYTYKITEQANCVAITPDIFPSELNYDLTYLTNHKYITLSELQMMISNEMMSTTVIVEYREYTGGV